MKRTAESLDAAKQLLADSNEAKRRPRRRQAGHVRFVDVAARYLIAYRTKRDGSSRPKSSLAKERTCLNVYLIPVLGNAWIGDLDLPELNATVRRLTLHDGTPASGSTKGTVASAPLGELEVPAPYRVAKVATSVAVRSSRAQANRPVERAGRVAA